MEIEQMLTVGILSFFALKHQSLDDVIYFQTCKKRKKKVKTTNKHLCTTV